MRTPFFPFAFAAILGSASFCASTALAQGSGQSFSGQSSSQAPASGQSYTPQQLQQMVAQIALYPDALVLQILQCAASPFQVHAVAQWLSQNTNLQGSALQEAAQKQGFDACFIAIVLFPDVIQKMDQDMDWTRQLGQAFMTDKTGVFDAVQALRKQAENAGNLQSNQQQTVSTQSTSDGQQVVVIQPANPQVVYVPQYNPETVYTETNSGNTAAAAAIGFAAGVIVGAAADDNDHNYYYACGGWGYHGPMVCNSGWNSYYNHQENMANDYYNHRQDMANDYYDHRNDMVQQRGDNQSNRQDAMSGNQSDRQQARSTNEQNRQQTWSNRNSGDPLATSQAQGVGQGNRAAADSRWQGADGSGSRGWQGGAQQNLGAQRGNLGGGQANNFSRGTNSGAFSGYQSGNTERFSANRGYSSMGGRFGGGGGGFRGRR